jgi:hypothetical protein
MCQVMHGDTKGAWAMNGFHSDMGINDGKFICLSRTLTPQLAAALIEAVEGLQYIQSDTSSTWLEEFCEERLQRIASTFFPS